ncbi:hypothetical protein EhV070 [Emiliania huxleyi virus 86]|uniref:Uncharacterized protein n=1 Tax=Emiliania huxleyi virus 86 (isolate United Kingdom/English Channel/1999) TaxID=654925 RepID=Q4A363_EHV8U|nr:hypothetical protein EhV070 [Emiliania huxleyi virus 86]AEO97882.1 hypothetical protein ENVG_00187 [Emiliania huxleyi virus 84]AEP15009.1 hypothetical protein EOVG_00072 [Emiliania huxleyi virus 88]AHA54639.1 hypothetical protein EhV145_00088 [Emiliania huxleyi virus 145]AHA55674.1 hypothetical protein EhV164_00084 [Emiliania huxleyi virus 164]CAI65493.1 hypothetical protein EhV070 [Emiliania huxleyi virus 86]
MSWIFTVQLLCRQLPIEIVNLITDPIFCEKVHVLQTHARRMLKHNAERSERIAIRYYETVLNNRREPVIIINGKRKWIFNKNIDYAKRVNHVIEHPVYRLPFKNPVYDNAYMYPFAKKRKLPSINRHYYFTD